MLDNVSVTYEAYQGDVEALQDIDLSVAEGEFLALLGPTGCGKSTLLKAVSGILQVSSGSVKVRGEPPTVAQARNEFGFVFQEAALLPWRTALANVALPLEVVGYARSQRRQRSEALLELVGLSEFALTYPHELSGGMRQRVSLVRSLAWSPSILLMDEPFSALDEITRERLQDDLLRIWQHEQKTVLFVTHNIYEAVYLANRIVVFTERPGRIAAAVDVPLPRPRSAEMRESVEFLKVAQRLREALREGRPA